MKPPSSQAVIGCDVWCGIAGDFPLPSCYRPVLTDAAEFGPTFGANARLEPSAGPAVWWSRRAWSVAFRSDGQARWPVPIRTSPRVPWSAPAPSLPGLFMDEPRQSRAISPSRPMGALLQGTRWRWIASVGFPTHQPGSRVESDCSRKRRKKKAPGRTGASSRRLRSSRKSRGDLTEFSSIPGGRLSGKIPR
jgi:hypothetical protein